MNTSPIHQEVVKWGEKRKKIVEVCIPVMELWNNMQFVSNESSNSKASVFDSGLLWQTPGKAARSREEHSVFFSY